MTLKVKLLDESYTGQPKLINLSTYRAVVLNVLAFVALGFVTVLGEFRKIVSDHEVDENKVGMFFLLFPVWIIGFHFAMRVLFMRRPNVKDSIWFLIKISVSVLILLLLFSDENYSVAQSVVGLAAILFLSLACFATFGYLNGYYGKIFAIINLTILFMQIFDNKYVDHFLWFNLLGLVDIDNVHYQAIVVFISFLLGYSDHTFSLLERTQN